MSLLKQGKWALAIAGAVIGGGVAQAAVYSSNANAASVKLGGVAAVSADAVAGSGTGSYSQTGTAATLGQSATLATVGAATLSERVGGTIGTERASGTGTQATGSISLTAPTIAFDSTTILPIIGTPIVSTLFGIDADMIGSASTVTNMNGVLTATGMASIANLRFTGLASPLAALLGSISLNPAANTSVSIGNTLTLTLNEQLRTAAAGALSLETNALHLNLNGYQIGGTALTGDIILGHSAASVTGVVAGAVPEPASWAMMLAGFGLVGATLRTSRRPRTMLA